MLDSVLFNDLIILFAFDGFVEWREIVFEECGEVNFMILLKSDISNQYFGLDQIHIDFVIIEFGVIVRDQELKREFIDVIMSVQHVACFFFFFWSNNSRGVVLFIDSFCFPGWIWNYGRRHVFEWDLLTKTKDGINGCSTVSL